MDVNFQNQKMKGEYILKGQFLMTKNENSVQQQHDLARVGEGGADRETHTPELCYPQLTIFNIKEQF